jgi:hypothetical protein
VAIVRPSDAWRRLSNNCRENGAIAVYLSETRASIDNTRPLFDRFGVPLLIFFSSCILYLIGIERAAHPDELYHLLAAHGLLEHGEPRIAEGFYTRVLGYTWLVARMLALLGDGLLAARLPSVLAMAGLNTLLFVWLRKETGWHAAALATGLFALSPFVIEIAQFIRFYALQCLFFIAGSLAVYEAARGLPPIRRRSIGYGLVAAACLAVALYLQPTTFLGIAGLGIWLISAVGMPWLTNPSVPRRRKYLAFMLALAGGLLLVGLSMATGVAAAIWFNFRWVPLFLEPRVNEFWFYHFFYILYYPSLWPIIGLLSFAALAMWPRVAWFAIVVFAVGFLLNSLAGPKNLRYMAYAQPFLFILFGLGLAAVLPWMARAGSHFKQQLETHLATVGLAGRRLPDVLLWSSLLVILVGNAALLRTVTLLAEITVPPSRPPIEWQATRPAVAPLLAEADVVVTMAELETLYFWKRYEVLFSASRLSEMADQRDFAADHRTGRPVIGTKESLVRLVDCTASGLFITTTGRWRGTPFIDVETASFIERELTRLDLPVATQLLVFTWRHLPDEQDGECAGIRSLLETIGG